MISWAPKQQIYELLALYKAVHHQIQNISKVRFQAGTFFFCTSIGRTTMQSQPIERLAHFFIFSQLASCLRAPFKNSTVNVRKCGQQQFWFDFDSEKLHFKDAVFIRGSVYRFCQCSHFQRFGIILIFVTFKIERHDL